jgi:hypothetical protein
MACKTTRKRRKRLTGRTGRKLQCSKAQVIRALKKHKGLVYLACQELKITKVTFYDYVRRWPSIREVQIEAKELRVDRAERKLDTLVNKGEFQAVRFTLATQGKERGYVERSEVRHGGNAVVTPSIIVNILNRPGAEQFLDGLVEEASLEQSAVPPLLAYQEEAGAVDGQVADEEQSE